MEVNSGLTYRAVKYVVDVRFSRQFSERLITAL